MILTEVDGIMTQHPVRDVTALIATTDEHTAKKAQGLFPHSKITRTARELEKAFGMPRGAKVEAASGQGEPIEIVLLDIDMPCFDGKELFEKVRGADQFTPILILSSHVNDHLDNALHLGAEDYLLKPFRAEDLVTRVRKLLAQRVEKARVPKLVAMDLPLPHLVEKLHDPQDGSLDARRVADFFGITVTDLSHLLRRGVSTVHKTPAAASLQEDLRQFESLASGLLRITGSERRSRMWLHANNPALEGHPPIELIKMGKVDDLAMFVQDLLEGRPA